MFTTAISENLTAVEDATCIAQKNWFAIGFMPLDSLAILLNLTLLVASMLDKEKLQRQNYTLACVNSALLSHIIYLSLKLWGASANIMAQNSPRVLGIPKIMWTVCESGASAIGFGVVANAFSVIYLTLDSTFVASRSVSRAGQAQNAKSNLPFKRKMAIFLMALSWIVPIAFITIATLAWNCAEDCWCPSSSFAGEVCPHEYRCSRLVTPLPTSYLLVQAGLWAIGIVALVILISRKYQEFKNSTMPQEETGLPSADQISIDMSVEKTQLKKHGTKMAAQPNKKQQKNRVRLNPRFRMAILLSTLLIFCFVPMSITIIVDAALPTANLMVAMMISMVCMYCYMLLFPIVLLKYLPNLRISLSKMMYKIFHPC